MEAKIEKLPDSKVKITIIVEAKKIEGYFQEALEKLNNQVEIKGFRKGKAPKMMILDKVGQARYNSEALNLAMPKFYIEALKSNNIIPISQPAISVDQFAEGKDFKFTAEVDILPKVELGDYKKIKIKYQKPKIEAKPEEVEKVLKRLQYQAAKYLDKSGGAEQGDRIEIEFEGKIKRVKSDKHSSKNFPLVLGEKIMMPGFEEKLLGMKKGEEKEFKLNVKGDDVDFLVKMLDIKKVQLPKIDDQFVSKFGRKSVLDLKNAIAQGIIQEKEMKDKQDLEIKLFDELLKVAKMEVPQSLVDQEISRKIQSLQAQMGPGFPEILKKSNKTITDIQKDMRPSAERSVKIGLILGEVSKDLNLIDKKPKTQQEQQEIIKKTIDQLIEIIVK